MRINKTSITREQSLNLFIAGLILLPIYIDLMERLSLVIGFSTKLTTYIYYGILWILLLISVPKIIRAISNNTIVYMALFVFMVLGQLIIFPNNRIYIVPQSFENLFIFSPTSLLGVVPYILIGLAVTDIQELIDFLHRSARIGIVLGAVSYLIAISQDQQIHYDDMANAYALCTLLCILLTNYQKNDVYFLVLGAFSLILAGTRGPIVCVIAAIIIRTLALEASAKKRMLTLVMGVLIIVVLQTDFLLVILGWVESFFNSLGVKDLRIVEYFREDMLTDSSGRDSYAELAIKYIGKSPVLGYGSGGDRLIIGQSYVHNIFLEMWVSYGIIVGTLILAWMGYWLIKGIRSKDAAVASLVSALFCSIVLKLFLSSSYLYSKELFILLGLCISYCGARRTGSGMPMKDGGQPQGLA